MHGNFASFIIFLVCFAMAFFGISSYRGQSTANSNYSNFSLNQKQLVELAQLQSPFTNQKQAMQSIQNADISAILHDYSIDQNYITSTKTAKELLDIQEVKTDGKHDLYYQILSSKELIRMSLNHSSLEPDHQKLRLPMFSLLAAPRHLVRYSIDEGKLTYSKVTNDEKKDYYSSNIGSFTVPESYDVKLDLYTPSSVAFDFDELSSNDQEDLLNKAYNRENMWLKQLKTIFTIKHTPDSEASGEDQTKLINLSLQIASFINDPNLSADDKTNLESKWKKFSEQLRSFGTNVTVSVADENTVIKNKDLLSLNVIKDSDSLTISWFHKDPSQKIPRDDSYLKEKLVNFVTQERQAQKFSAFSDKFSDLVLDADNDKLPSLKDSDVKPVTIDLKRINSNNITEKIEGNTDIPTKARPLLEHDIRLQVIDADLGTLNSVPLLQPEFISIYRITKTQPAEIKSYNSVETEIEDLLTKLRKKEAYTNATAALTDKLVMGEDTTSNEMFSPTLTTESYTPDNFRSEWWVRPSRDYVFAPLQDNQNFADIIFIKHIDTDQQWNDAIPDTFESSQYDFHRFAMSILQQNAHWNAKSNL
ncbi:MAG: hypothetical protein ACON5A_05315 [Candidatus Comchoanobacterales bacterium]